MIVVGLIRLGIDDPEPQLALGPALARRPLRSGARLPWKRSSGNGPLWQSRHRPTWRLATMARPRAGSPLAPVSDCGIASCACADAAARRGRDERGREPSHPKTSAVIVRNQASASTASAARVARGASAGLTPPAPGTSASCPPDGW